ncbi:MAG: MBL fold metallo-hydrolase [Clostridia bacterium]|nr:MBL fold metallo-hydrolase [Clostridia bacterium]
MKLKWLGHSCFQLTLDNESVLVTDPYDDSVGYPPLNLRADAALSSHGHFDHNNFAAIEGDPVILNAPGVREICGARITGVPSFHDDAGGAKRGANIIHVIEADGLKIVHLGDLGHLPDTDEQRAALSDADVLLVPIGGFFTIDTPAAVKLIEAYRPRSAIAMHFANRYCHFTVSDESEFMRLTGARRLPNEIELTKDEPAGCCVMEI